jgi:hypothetical protein
MERTALKKGEQNLMISDFHVQKYKGVITNTTMRKKATQSPFSSLAFRRS